MKRSRRIQEAVLILALGWFATAQVVAQHAHIYAGAVSQTAGAALYFQNGNVWDTNSYGGYTQAPACIYFQDSIPDIYPGLYQSATTFSALPATIFRGGPSPYAAMLGTYIEIRFVSLQGPAGASLTVWNENPDPTQPSLLFTVPVGTANGTNRFNLSEGDPSDSFSDPYGHIHGQRFTLNKSGLYTLGLQLVDTSHNGPGGGPVHTSSAITYFYLQAGLHLSNFSRSNNVAVARFGLPGFTSCFFEASAVLPATNWLTVATVTGTSHSELRWVRDTNAASQTRFYRIRMGTDSAAFVAGQTEPKQSCEESNDPKNFH